MADFFSIPKPCSENWNDMDATEQGAFCSICTKEVIDCTTIKTSKIKATLADKKAPCIKIYSEQIDEMNFLEWFNSLRIKTQLKYAFLFAFILVFNSRGIAQDTANVAHENIELTPTQNDSNAHVIIDTVIVENPINELDSIKETTIDETLTDSTSHSSDSLALLEVSVNEELYLSPHESIEPFLGSIATEPILTGDLDCGTTTGFAVFGNWIVEPYSEPTSPFLTNQPYKIEHITNSNNLALRNSRFSFLIDGDSLHFMSYAVEPERIRINITKKGDIKPIYFNPIQIERDKKEVIFPLNNFDNGTYIVTVESEENAKSIELVYW